MALEPKSFPLISPAPLGSSTWLLHLRSIAVAGQLATILAAGCFTSVDLPVESLLGLVALTAITNLVYGFWLGRRDATSDVATTDHDHAKHAVALTLMLLDLITLTLMLHLSGGIGNPFSFFYFVNLAVGGVMIRPRAAWALTVTAVLGYLFLLMRSQPLIGLTSVVDTSNVLQATGMMFAFATCSAVVTYFVTRTAGELRTRERQLLMAQAEQASSRRLEGLTTLAAGAAHELATPLSTIDVIVRELSRHLEGCEKPESVETDLRLIDGQLEMCKQILQRMRAAAGDSMAQRWDRTTVGDLIDTILEGIRDPHRVDVTDGTEDVEGTPLWVPQEAVAQAVRNLIHNGLDASGREGRVRLDSRVTSQTVELRVADGGDGMSEEVLDRASDPFFTTKEPGRGIGLGLFLARNVISQLGGSLEFRSRIGVGTEAIVTIPRSKMPEADLSQASGVSELP